MEYCGPGENDGQATTHHSTGHTKVKPQTKPVVKRVGMDNSLVVSNSNHLKVFET